MRKLIAFGHRVTRSIAPFVTPERVLVFLLTATVVGLGVKLAEAIDHECPAPPVVAVVTCPEPVACPECQCPPEGPTCPTVDTELVHPNPNCRWAVQCEEE